MRRSSPSLRRQRRNHGKVTGTRVAYFIKT
jgi:hypothetical protein